MNRARAIVGKLAALLLVLALGIAPGVLALTHGPGQIVAGADHALMHAGHHPAASDHGQHDSADHDHAAKAILISGGTMAAPQGAEIWQSPTDAPGGVIRDGPRRPPRLT